MSENRIKLIMRTSVVGIIVNVFLATFKVVIGMIANSISIMLDGVNNYADAGSSLITIVGAALAGRSADKKHPFGYGRIEYISALIISGLVLYAGVTALIESVQAIINPEPSDYTTITLVIVAVAVIVKLMLALYTQKMGHKTNSDSLIASGKDALLDVVMSISTLVAALIFVFSGIALEAYLGAIIAIVIIKSGIELLKETLSKIIGEPADVQLAINIKKTIAEFDGVHGAYDLVINDYGPETYMASVHIEVDDCNTVSDMDKLSREITQKVLAKHGVVLTAIGFYSRITSNEQTLSIEKHLREIALKQEYIRGIHGMYIDLEQKYIQFDLVVSLDSKDRSESFENALNAIKAEYKDYEVHAAMDMDLNEAIHKE